MGPHGTRHPHPTWTPADATLQRATQTILRRLAEDEDAANEAWRHAPAAARLRVYALLDVLEAAGFVRPEFRGDLGEILHYGMTIAGRRALAATPLPPAAAPAPMSPFGIADEAIQLFLEYRDQYGYNEQEAHQVAAQGIAEGCAVTDDELLPSLRESIQYHRDHHQQRENGVPPTPIQGCDQPVCRQAVKRAVLRGAATPPEPTP